jgi:hypothetical protein
MMMKKVASEGEVVVATEDQEADIEEIEEAIEETEDQEAIEDQEEDTEVTEDQEGAIMLKREEIKEVLMMKTSQLFEYRISYSLMMEV